MSETTFSTALMDKKAAATYLRTTVASLNTWRATGKHNIPYVRFGHCIRYRKEDLDAWIAEHLENVQPVA